MLAHRTLLALFLFVFALSAIAQNMSEHIVKRGESFASIANKYGLTEEQLKQANPQKSICYVGLKLNIPVIERNNEIVNENNVNQSVDIANLHSEQTMANQFEVKKEKNERRKKKSFWKSIGEVATGIGEVVVASAEILNETDLIDKTGTTGQVIGGTADLVNMAGGKQSNFLGAATKGEYNSDGTGTAVNESSLSSSSSSATEGNLVGLQNRLAYVDRRLEQINNELIATSNERNKSQTKMYAEVQKTVATQQKYQKHNNSVNLRKGLKNSAAKIQQSHGTAISNADAKRNRLNNEKSALLKERSELKKRIEQLQNGGAENLADDDNYESPSSGSKHSYEYWESEYRSRENLAKRHYDSLTNLGYKVKKNGKDVGGSTMMSMGGGNYLSMKRSLREAQSLMRKTRMNAKKDGFDIPQSEYETVTVSY